VLGVCAFFCQFVKAKINENIVKINVIGVNSFCSILFFEVAFPIVLNRNMAVITQSIIVIAFLGKSIVKKWDCTNMINKKKRFIIIDTISNRYISVSVFNRPPQTML
jgi:hypothetical protein